MNRPPFTVPLIWLVGGVLLFSSSLQADISSPTHLRIRKAGNSVKVDLLPGPMQLTLEGRSGAGWKPLAVRYVNRQPKKSVRFLGFLKLHRYTPPRTSFHIPRGYKRSQLRVMARPIRFPVNFLSNPRQFAGEYPNFSNPQPYYYANTRERFIVEGDVAIAAAATASNSTPAAPTPLVVEESDIWKVVGDQLFFFNEFRGLQVFDLSNPKVPIRTGTLRLTASGEQFFALDSKGTRLALLARDPVQVGANETPSFYSRYKDEDLSVHLLSVDGGVPSLVESLPLRGRIIDSRLVGNRLYVLCHRYWDDDGTNNWRSILHGFDLSDPAQPIVLKPVTLPGQYNPILQAFPGTLLVFTAGGTNRIQASTAQGSTASSVPTGRAIHVLDISGPDGQPTFVKSLPTTGNIRDKFKLQLADGVITAVSASFNWTNRIGRQTWVETFPADGPETAPLDRIEILGARGELLYATRFDGDRLYVVTFRRIDPLFVIDLSDPAALAVTGFLEIPGWSTYIAPYGNRLVSVGVEGNQVAVSLFDVSDDTAPALLSRVFLGNGRSWSEANYDEKAVGFFPEEGLLMVPYQTFEKGKWINAVAVIEVTPQVLTQHGAIHHDFKARRASVSEDRIISVSGQELVVVDASDLANPTLLAQLSLAWKVDRVVPFGPDHLIQIEEGARSSGNYYSRVASSSLSGGRAMIRVSRSDDPDAVVEEIEMGEGRLIGAVRKGDRLLVGQVIPGDSGAPEIVRTWVFDISKPPKIRETDYADSRLPQKASAQMDFDNVQALWPKPEMLVWHVNSPTVRYWGYSPPIFVQIDAPALQRTVQLDTTRTFVAVSSSAAKPKLSPPRKTGFGLNQGVSTAISEPGKGAPNQKNVAVLLPVSFDGNGSPSAKRPVFVKGATPSSRSSTATAFAANGFVFTTYEDQFRPTATGKRWRPTPSTRYRSWLKVVDFRIPNSPVVRNRVSIPGRLLGVRDVDGSGAILFTDNSFDTSRPGLTASAYDGVNAYRVNTWNDEGGAHVTAAASDENGQLFAATDGEKPAITSLGFDAQSGEFEVSDVLPVSGSRNELHVIDNYLLASSWGRLNTVEIDTDASFLSPASFDTPGNLWIQVSRAAVEPQAGIWLPVLDYGVEYFGFEDLSSVAASQQN